MSEMGWANEPVVGGGADRPWMEDEMDALERERASRGMEGAATGPDRCEKPGRRLGFAIVADDEQDVFCRVVSTK